MQDSIDFLMEEVMLLKEQVNLRKHVPAFARA
jgi:hypothetical protein